MKKKTIGMLASIPFILAALPLWAGEGQSAQEAFERLKSLKGDWRVEQEGGETTELTYRLHSGGSALFEHFQHGPSERAEFDSEDLAVMVSVFYVLDGQLKLDHYCTAGNQPRLSARRLSPQVLEFEFDSLGGDASARSEGHIHRVIFRFQGDDHFVSEWSYRDADGEEHTSVRRHTRLGAAE